MLATGWEPASRFRRASGEASEAASLTPVQFLPARFLVPRRRIARLTLDFGICLGARRDFLTVGVPSLVGQFVRREAERCLRRPG